jgi:poly [ADP-ribose] polymerase
MLQSDSNASAYYVWTHWGRVGKTAGTDLRNCSSRDDAIRAFGEKFSSKTKNHWADRQHFVSYSGKYTLLARDYFAEEEKKNPAPAANATVSSAVPKSKLDARLQDLIQLICDTKMMSRELAELNYDANKLPLGKLTKEIVLKGYAALEEINRALKNNAKAPELQRLSSQFYTYIPHDFGMRRPTVIMTRDLLAEKIRMVEQLAEVEIATKLLNQGQNSSSADAVHPLDAHFANLHCGIRPVDLKSQEAELVRQYINNTHGHTHSEYKLLLEVWFILSSLKQS